MRTTIAIDDDVLAAARTLAERERRSIGDVISALARNSLHQPPARARSARNGIPLLAGRKSVPPVTPEIVQALRDEAG